MDGPVSVHGKIIQSELRNIGAERKEFVVHLNRLKAYHGATDWDPTQETK